MGLASILGIRGGDRYGGADFQRGPKDPGGGHEGDGFLD